MIEELASSVLLIEPAGRDTVPLDTVRPVMLLKAPLLLSLKVPPVYKPPSDRFKFATLLPVEFNIVKIVDDPPCKSKVVLPPEKGMFVSEIAILENVQAPVIV